MDNASYEKLQIDLMNMAMSYWIETEKRDPNKGSVKWLKNNDSQNTLIITRGEYNEQLTFFVDNIKAFKDLNSLLKPLKALNKTILDLIEFKKIGGELLYGVDYSTPISASVSKNFKYIPSMFIGISKKLFDSI